MIERGSRRRGAPRERYLRLALLLAWAAAPVAPLAAQEPAESHLFVGSEVERYLRVLQLGGGSVSRPWSLRGEAGQERDRARAAAPSHPWSARYDFAGEPPAGIRLRLLPVEVGSVFNSAFPYGRNDGPVWAGRGTTLTATAGLNLEAGPLALRLAPIVFRAENAAADLFNNGQQGALRYGAHHPNNIDLPQRFGDGSYARLDAGESYLGLSAVGLTAGVSTAAQQWGPALEQPLVLGRNAGGFPHVFAGTARPLNLGLGRAHGRIVWGVLGQSAYSPVQEGEGRRFATGMVAVFQPRGLAGLELGGTRFFHMVWPEGGPGASEWARLFEALFKSGVRGGDDENSRPDNQLASIFARWAVPGSGFEVYGEFAREDHSWNLRDFLLEPDHNSGYVTGFQKVWTPSAARHWVARGEVMNTRMTHLVHVRSQGPFYVHTRARQGHTLRGQLLGAPAGYGGDAAHLGVDLYHARGRVTLEWERATHAERLVTTPQGASFERDVTWAVGADVLRHTGRFDVRLGLTAAENVNRHFEGDAFNLRLALGLRAGLGPVRRAAGPRDEAPRQDTVPVVPADAPPEPRSDTGPDATRVP
jgi:hypothetical protein